MLTSKERLLLVLKCCRKRLPTIFKDQYKSLWVEIKEGGHLLITGLAILIGRLIGVVIAPLFLLIYTPIYMYNRSGDPKYVKKCQEYLEKTK